MSSFVAAAVVLGAALVASPAARADAAAEERPWTFMIYAAADNNADGPVIEFVDRLSEAWNEDPGMEIVLFIDRSARYYNGAEFLGEDFADARLYRVRKHHCERLDGGKEFPEITLDGEYEANSADPTNLRKFIAFIKRAFPAKRYGLMIYSHASGASMCPDEVSGRDMGIAELSDIVGPAESVDFMGLELCNMCGLEIAYQWRPGNGGFSTETLVAIPNAGPPLAWERVFARFKTRDPSSGELPKNAIDPRDLDGPTFGRMIIEEGEAGRKEHPAENAHAVYEAAASLDLNGAEPAKQALDALAVALFESGKKAEFAALRGPGGADGKTCAMNYSDDDLAGGRAFVDVYDIAKRVAASDQFPASVTDAAKTLMARIDDLVDASFGMSGYRGFEAGKNGVFIVCPDGDHTALLGAKSWSKYDWYGPGPNDECYGHWAACADGAVSGDGKVENWFELLDAWFDVDDGKGGMNGYRV